MATISRPCRNLLDGCFMLVCLLLLGGGCGRNAPPPEALPADQVVPALQGAFKSAKPDVKALADAAVSAVEGKDPATAFAALQGLSARTDLTAEQRSVVARSVLTVNEQMQAAAARGEAKAVEATKAYQMDK